MTTKWWNFNSKKYLILILLVLPFHTSFSQNGYDKRIEKYSSVWQKLIPSHQKIQFAGGMGLISVGTGWDYGKNNQWETDVFLGFVPKYSTKNNKITLTVKQNFIPWNTDLGKNFSTNLLACGIYVNSIFGEDFWHSEPSKYPNGYYSFSTKMRFNAYIGQRLTYNIAHNKRIFAKSLTFYYELSSCDLYIVSAFTNSYIGPKDIVKLSLGLKMQLF